MIYYEHRILVYEFQDGTRGGRNEIYKRKFDTLKEAQDHRNKFLEILKVKLSHFDEILSEEANDFYNSFVDYQNFQKDLGIFKVLYEESCIEG